jgi:hypothetical protein
MGVGRAAVLHEAIESDHLHIVGPVYEVLFGEQQVVHVVDHEEILARKVAIPHDPFYAIFEDNVADLEAVRGNKVLLLAVFGGDDADAIGEATSEDLDALRGEELLPDLRVAEVEDVHLFTKGQCYLKKRTTRTDVQRRKMSERKIQSSPRIGTALHITTSYELVPDDVLEVPGPVPSA